MTAPTPPRPDESQPSADLSDDAKAVAGGLFGMGGRTKVTFQMVESRPTARTQAALDELVAVGLVTKEDGPNLGGVTYTGSLGCRRYFRWIMWHEALARFPISEPIT